MIVYACLPDIYFPTLLGGLVLWYPRIPSTRVFAIYQILLGWKTYKYYYETDELPNPRPTQPKEKNQVKSGI